MTREYKKWKNRSTNKNEQLLKIQHYIKVRLLHDRQFFTDVLKWNATNERNQIVNFKHQTDIVVYLIVT